MPPADPQFRLVTREGGIEVIQSLGSGWAATYFIGRDRPTIRAVTIGPLPQTLIGGPAPTGELTSKMLRDLVPGAAIAYAVKSYDMWAGPAAWPGPDGPAWISRFLSGERLSWILGPEWLALIEKLEGRPLQIDPGDARRWRMIATAARYVAAAQVGDRAPVATVAKEFGLSQSQIRDRLYAARRAGLLEETGRGRAGGDLTPAGRALFLEMSESPSEGQ
jgi:hypothetical protein